jgi:hypothetical protein
VKDHSDTLLLPSLLYNSRDFIRRNFAFSAIFGRLAQTKTTCAIYESTQEKKNNLAQLARLSRDCFHDRARGEGGGGASRSVAFRNARRHSKTLQATDPAQQTRCGEGTAKHTTGTARTYREHPFDGFELDFGRSFDSIIAHDQLR